jgi:hypothetical protein
MDEFARKKYTGTKIKKLQIYKDENNIKAKKKHH